MAPVRRGCRVHSDVGLRRLSHQSAAANNHRTFHCCRSDCNNVTVRTCPTAEPDSRRRRRHRRHRLQRQRCFRTSMLRHDSCWLLTTARRRTHGAVVVSAVAAVNADVDDAAHRDCAVTTSSAASAVRGVQQQHFLTFMYCAALVDQLTLQLSQLQLHTDSRSRYDNTDKPVSSLSAAACGEQLASSSSNCRNMLHTDITTSLNSGPNTQLSVDELRATSMKTLLRQSCRIPRPVAVDRTART